MAQKTTKLLCELRHKLKLKGVDIPKLSIVLFDIAFCFSRPISSKTAYALTRATLKDVHILTIRHIDELPTKVIIEMAKFAHLQRIKNLNSLKRSPFKYYSSRGIKNRKAIYGKHYF